MRSRIAAIGVVLVLAAGLLSACRSNVGVAARVGGHEISENSVSDYILASGPRTTSSASPAAGTITPKPVVLNYLVQREVFRQILQARGQLPTDAQLSARRDRALQFLGVQVPSATFVDSIRTQLGQTAVKASFAPVYLQVQELLYTLITSGHITTPAQFASAVRGVDVRVNPRYGRWVVDASRGAAQILTTGNQPGYLQLQAPVTSSGTGGA